MKSNFIYMKGVVIKSTGSLYQVLVDGKKQYSCKIKGKNGFIFKDYIRFRKNIKNEIC